MNSLDTNIILRYILNDIPDQTLKAREIIIDTQCYITDVVIIEVIYVLEKVIEIKRSDIVKLIKMFFNLHNLEYNDNIFDEVLILYEKLNTLSIVDCYATVEAKLSNSALISFDKDLIKYGGGHVKLA